MTSLSVYSVFFWPKFLDIEQIGSYYLQLSWVLNMKESSCRCLYIVIKSNIPRPCLAVPRETCLNSTPCPGFLLSDGSTVCANFVLFATKNEWKRTFKGYTWNPISTENTRRLINAFIHVVKGLVLFRYLGIAARKPVFGVSGSN